MARRAVFSAAIVILLTAAVIGAGAWWSNARGASPSPSSDVPVATTPVIRANLASTTQLSGTLGYSGATTLLNQGPAGILTSAPRPGQMITRGRSAYELNGTSVPLFYGPKPEWRTLAVGVAPGTDVRQLEANLVALGYATPQQVTVDGTFTWATEEAVVRWQRALSVPLTGQVQLGAVVYAPGPLRIVRVEQTPGAPVQPGQPLLDATTTTAVVTVAVPTARNYLVHDGDLVGIKLPTGSATTGRITSIATVATGGQNSSGGGSDTGGAGPTQASVEAVVALTHPQAADGFDQAPVTVTITDRTVRNVLAVPVTALVALSSGGYGVYVHSGARTSRHLVAVTPGLFATTLVQVTPSQGSELQAGDRVEVPSP